VPDERAHIAEIALVGVCAVWGVTFPMVKDAVAEIGTMTFLAYRFFAATAVVVVVFRKELATLSRAGLRAGAGMGAWLGCGYILQTLGLERTSVSNTGFITGMFVVLTPVFGALLMGQRAGRTAWRAAGVSMLGLLLLSGVGGPHSNPLGDFLVFLTACAFSLHILVTDRAVENHSIGALLAVQLAVVALFCSVIAAGAGDLVVPKTMTVWSALAVTAFVASALGFFVQSFAQTHAPPARVALILTSEPLFAGLFAYLLKGETLTPAQLAGAALIMAAIVSVELVPYLRRETPLPER
jgi:drug/metabolite transporter (DMT)-like permease